MEIHGETFMGKKHSLEAFSQNLMKIEEHNQRGDIGYKLGINKFSGFSHEEIVDLMNLKATYKCPVEGVLFQSKIPVAEDDWDYRTLGVASPVRDQGFQG